MFFFIIYTILFKCDLICTHHCVIIFRVSGWDFAVAIWDYETSEIKIFSILKTTNNKWFYSLCIKLYKMVISNGCIVLFLLDCCFFLRSTKIIKFVSLRTFFNTMCLHWRSYTATCNSILKMHANSLFNRFVVYKMFGLIMGDRLADCIYCTTSIPICSSLSWLPLLTSAK